MFLTGYLEIWNEKIMLKANDSIVNNCIVSINSTNIASSMIEACAVVIVNHSIVNNYKISINITSSYQMHCKLYDGCLKR